MLYFEVSSSLIFSQCSRVCGRVFAETGLFLRDVLVFNLFDQCFMMMCSNTLGRTGNSDMRRKSLLGIGLSVFGIKDKFLHFSIQLISVECYSLRFNIL